MTLRRATFITLSFCIIAAGCNGDNAVSPYGGSYQGTFTSSNATDQGTVTMTINDSGDVSGTLIDDANAPPTQEDMSGSIDTNGDFTGEFTDSAGTSPFGGNLGYDNSGHLSGPVNITAPGGVIHAQFNLAFVNGKMKYGTRIATAGKAPPSGSKALLK